MRDNMKLSDLLIGVGRPVAYYPKMRRITGSTNATIFLCQFAYWTGKEASGDGWIYKTSKEIEEETGLSYKEQTTAREKLVAAGLLSERYARLDHQMHFKLNQEAIDEKWRTSQTDIPEPTDGKMANTPTGCSLISNTETTTENTTNSEEKKSRVPAGFPEPTGDHLGDWMKVERNFQEKNQPFIDLLAVLSSEFGYNFPRFGESHNLDRVVKLIVKDGRDVKKFIAWAKDKKRVPHWYHLKPDTLWGDFPQAFAEAYDNSARARLERERMAQNGNGQGNG
jgi:hypothetical protein